LKELLILLSPVIWSIKNNIVLFNRRFYKNSVLYAFSSITFIVLITKLLNAGMIKLQSLSTEVFTLLLIKGYSLIFVIIFFIQIINGIVISFNTYYQSAELELLLTSPVNRISLFFSRLVETHLKASWMLIIFGIPLIVSSGLIFHTNLIYYFYSLLLFILFSIIPVNIGIGITIALSGIFSVRKLKKAIASAGVITVVAIITLLRIFKPERFVNPELFANLTLFLSDLKTPSFILLPNRWLSEALFNFLNKNYSDIFIFVALLFLTPYLTVFFLASIYKKYHYRGWSLLQGGGIVLKGRHVHTSYIANVAKKLSESRAVQYLLSLLDIQSRVLLSKDLKCQIRDIKNAHQLLILLSLITVYLLSIAALPLNWEGYAAHLKYFISFFNLGLILIIVTSLCARLVYPAIISEGNALWILKTSPIMPKRYVWTKFLFFFIPILFLGELLTVFSSFFIDIEKPFFILKIVTTALLCFSLVSMTIAFGIFNLKNVAGEIAGEETKAGSTMYMITSFLLILFTLALEIVPIYLLFLKESAKIEFTQKAWLILGALGIILLLVNILVTGVSMHLSAKRFDKLQIS